LTHAEFTAMRRFPGLDGLRAIAASIVIFSHFAGPKWNWLSGWVGVYIFFVLSGFLITTLLLREQTRAGRISMKNFYIRRVFRILPPYVAILGVVVLFCHLRGEYTSRGFSEALPYYLTFFNEFLPAASTSGGDNLFTGSWTLGIEEKFYLAWPLLLVLAGAAAARRRLVLVIAALAAMLLLVPVTTGGWVINYSMTALYESSIHYFVLLVGCLLAILMHDRRTFALVRPLTHPVAVLPVLAVFLAVHTNMTDAWGDTRNNLMILVVYSVVVVALLVTLITPGPLQWLLSTAPMRFVGERSYSLYLLQSVGHLLVVLTVPQFGEYRTTTAIAVFVVSLLGADLIYRWVEMPMINCGKRIIERREQRVSEPAEPAREQVDAASARLSA
jgi:peptidoglycan/LPS O-acetylase OafA/YrhL